MADNDNDPGAPEAPEAPGTPESGEAPTAETSPVIPPDAPAPARPVLVPRWRDRAWSFRAMLAVALATFLVGGLAGGAIVAMADDDHPDHGRFVIMPGGRGDRMPPGWRMPHRFRDGGPQWRWDDGPQPPGSGTAPDSTPSPSPTPKP